MFENAAGCEAVRLRLLAKGKASAGKVLWEWSGEGELKNPQAVLKGKDEGGRGCSLRHGGNLLLQPVEIGGIGQPSEVLVCVRLRSVESGLVGHEYGSAVEVREQLASAFPLLISRSRFGSIRMENRGLWPWQSRGLQMHSVFKMLGLSGWLYMIR